MKQFLLLAALLFAPYLHADILQAKAHGFHWYSQEAPEKIERKTQLLPPPVLSPYERLMEVRKQTRNKLSKALLEPSFEATVEYMKAQQAYAKNNQAFVRFWQEALLMHPELDNTLNFPTDNSAIAIRNDSMKGLMEKVIREGAHQYGLIFFYQGSHSISQKMVEHLLPFVQSSKFAMISVATDGQAIDGLPNSKNIPLNVLQQKLNLQSRYLPALFLVNLKTKRMSPLSYGFVSTTELKERLLDVATNYQRFSYEGISA